MKKVAFKYKNYSDLISEEEFQKFKIYIEKLGLYNYNEKEYYDNVILRCSRIKNDREYPAIPNIIQGWPEYSKTLFFHSYYPIIKQHTIPTIIVNELKETILSLISKEMQWERLFIKSSIKSLFSISEFTSVWPTTSIQKMKDYFNNWGIQGPFAIRKFIDEPEIFYNEQRYWILNGNAYHPSGKIPDFVKEYGKKMYEFSGSHYFTMDVAGNYIVEINPGESSDRGGDNPLDWFCEIFAKEFLYK